jgi:hypothetical protein
MTRTDESQPVSQVFFFCTLVHVNEQENVKIRGWASLISLISDQFLNAHSLQDIEFTFVNTDDDDNLEPVDYYALVKDVADIAPSTCNGNSIRNRIIVKVNILLISTLPTVLGVLQSKVA